MARFEPSTRYVTVTPTLDTNAYASGDRLGSIQTLTGALEGWNTGSVLSVAIVDAAAQKSAMNIWFFDSLPTIASADNAALDLTDANALKCLGFVAVAAADYVDSASNAVACVKNINLGVQASKSNSGVEGTLYVVLESLGSPTYAASSLTFKYYFGLDQT